MLVATPPNGSEILSRLFACVPCPAFLCASPIPARLSPFRRQQVLDVKLPRLDFFSIGRPFVVPRNLRMGLLRSRLDDPSSPGRNSSGELDVVIVLENSNYDGPLSARVPSGSAPPPGFRGYLVSLEGDAVSSSSGFASGISDAFRALEGFRARVLAR